MQYKTWDEWAWYGDADLLFERTNFPTSSENTVSDYFIIKTAALGIHLSYIPVTK